MRNSFPGFAETIQMRIQPVIAAGRSAAASTMQRARQPAMPSAPRRRAHGVYPELTPALVAETFRVLQRQIRPRWISWRNAAGVALSTLVCMRLSTYFSLKVDLLVAACAVVLRQLLHSLSGFRRSSDAQIMLGRLRDRAWLIPDGSRKIWHLLRDLSRVNDAINEIDSYICVRQSGGLALWRNANLRVTLGIGLPDISAVGATRILADVDAVVDGARVQLRRIESGLLGLLQEVMDRGHFDDSKYSSLEEMLKRRLPPPKNPWDELRGSL